MTPAVAAANLTAAERTAAAETIHRTENNKLVELVRLPEIPREVCVRV